MGALTLTVQDETTAGEQLAALELQLASDRLTLRELIRERVHQEVRAYNAQVNTGMGRFFGLVQPSDTERELNGYRMRKPRRIDPDKQTDVALSAFERGHVLVLVNDSQVEDLDAELVLPSHATVTFLKLVPLVGG